MPSLNMDALILQYTNITTHQYYHTPILPCSDITLLFPAASHKNQLRGVGKEKGENFIPRQRGQAGGGVRKGEEEGAAHVKWLCA